MTVCNRLLYESLLCNCLSVYRVNDQKLPGSEGVINVTKFATLLERVRPSNNEGLVLFSGDLFSPSIESTVTRGSHMVPIMNYLAPDVALTGELVPSK